MTFPLQLQVHVAHTTLVNRDIKQASRAAIKSDFRWRSGGGRRGGMVLGCRQAASQGAWGGHKTQNGQNTSFASSWPGQICFQGPSYHTWHASFTTHQSDPYHTPIVYPHPCLPAHIPFGHCMENIAKYHHLHLTATPFGQNLPCTVWDPYQLPWYASENWATRREGYLFYLAHHKYHPVPPPRCVPSFSVNPTNSLRTTST